MLEWLKQPFSSVGTLIEMGGDVIYVLLIVTMVMWTLLAERFWYLYRVHPRHIAWATTYWKARVDRHSWRAHKIRELLISDSDMRAKSLIAMIDTMVKVCPLLGLLGTVTGMMAIFDAMAYAGSGNAKAMAAGVSKATIPTMVGIATSLFGLVLLARLNQRTRQVDHSLNENLIISEKL